MKSIKIFDHTGNPLTIEASLGKIQEAQMWLEEKRLSSEKLKGYESLLRWTQEAINNGFYQ